ncbi:energy transducer TonB [Bdellovibrionota bacterium FG-1]
MRRSVVLSALFHAIFGVACLILLRLQAHSPAPRRLTWVELDPSVHQKVLVKSEQEQFKNKIVQTSKGQEAKTAAPDSYLGEKTRIVDRQTVSSQRMTVMEKKGKTAATQAKARNAAESGEKTPSMALKKLGLAVLPEARRPGAEKELAKDEPQWANIGAEPQDYIEGIRQSDRTALNTREYAFFGYHQRIRQRLEMEWTTLLREALTRFYRGGRQLASETEYVTRVLVVLNSRGEITKVKLVSASGTQELDQVAVEAFNRAGPFPNPPRGLIKNGEVEVPWELRLRS